jgi:Carboxypeptidase regulatory-like domain/TonB dependent receptor
MNKLGIGILLAFAAGWGQTHTVTVRGIVKDSSGGVLRNAAVSATNVDQARHWNTRTGDSGEYVLVQIPPGNYSLSVAAPGFKTYERTGLVLQVAQTAELDVSLEVGAVGESVEVVAETPLTEPGSSFLGEVVNGSLAGALPLFTRDINQLVALTPGVSDSPNFRQPKFSSGNSNQYSASGGPGGANEIILDGSPQTTMWLNQAGYVPQPEATLEFNVQTNSLAAEYGHTGGAVVNIVHRSGTREFHGKVYEYLRNEKLNANSFFENRNGKSRAPFRGNDFGFVLGGPLTPARNSTFFFLNVQRILVAAPISKTMTVPTVRMKNGDFGEAGLVYDPGSIDSTGARRLFPQNQIPAGLWNPVGVNLLKYYPDPTSPGASNNLFARATEHPAATDVSLKIDRRVSARQNLFGRFSMENSTDERPNYFGNPASPDAVTANSRSGSVTLDDSYVRGSWILHGNYGYVHTGNTAPPAVPGFDPASLGFPASMRSGLQVANVPVVTLAGSYSWLGPLNNQVGTGKYENHSLSGDAIRVAGRHTVKFGGTYRINRASILQSISPSGSFTFAEGFTTSAAGTAGSGGSAVASLLLGLPTSGGVGYEPALAIQVRYAALFVQDDWRVSSRLTLNLGLRWDSDRPLTERFDRTSWFDFNALLPVTAPGLGPLRGGLVFAGKNGAPRGNKDPDNNNFGPRAGLAYSATPHFVLRSGFGIMCSPTLDNGPTSTNTGALGFNAFTPYISSADGFQHPFTTLSNPFPNGFNTPTGARDGLLTFIGQTVNAQVRSDRTPYVAQWHFNTQYEWHKDMLLDVGYAGSAGVKLAAQGQLNQLPDQFLGMGKALDRIVANPFYGIVPGTNTLPATVTAGQLLRPYPQFNKVIQTWGSFAHSSYHALQAKLRKRYRRGFQVLAAYTWSKMLDDNSGSFNGGNQSPPFMDNNRRDLDKSYSVFDIPHRLVASFEYELPFGAGRALLNRAGLANAIAGGWRASGIATYAAGAPISVSQGGTNQTGSFDGISRPNRTGISSATPGSVKERIDNYLNPAAFSAPPPYTFGNAGRFMPDVRGPGRQNWDVALAKSFPIGDKFHVDFQAEAFNLLNHANFLGPYPPGQTAFGQPGFGTIVKTDSARQMQLALSLNF